MPFEPAVCGPQASSALNALVRTLERRNQPYNASLYHTFTQPSGTAFEADLLLSCTGFDHSAVCRIVDRAISRDMLQTTGDEELLEAFGNPLGLEAFHYPSVGMIVAHIRGCLLPKITTSRTQRWGNAFSDTLFGPRVAKVLNSLLKLEVWVANGGVGMGLLHARIFVGHPSRRPLALCIQQGTAYAADVLTVQHNFPLGGLATFLHKAEPRADFGLMNALFQTGPPPPREDADQFFEAVRDAIRSVRAEMLYVTETVDGRMVPILSAGHPRLGADSWLGRMDQEVLRMIVCMGAGVEFVK